MGLQVIGAGFGRTGTNSFHVAMETLGFSPCHHMKVVMMNPPDEDVWARAAAGTLTDWDELYGGFAATCDFPHCVFYEELAAFYPDAKVVLTVRDPEAWYKSATSTIFSPESVARMTGAAGQDPSMMGPLTESIVKVISRVVDVANVADREATIASFNAYNEAVKATIPPERLLVYEVSQGWEPLCGFLEVPVPDEPFPVTNTTEDFRSRRGIHDEIRQARDTTPE